MSDLFNSLANSTIIDNQTVILRIVLSFFAGAIIGIEREAHRQLAGLRTHMLICIGSTIIMLLSIYIPQIYPQFQNGDPGRIAAQVVSGIGFIGAGAILRMGINVRGLTTAASIWSIAAIGLVIGAGMYLTAGIAVALILIVLMVVDALERKFFTPVNYKNLTIATGNPESNSVVQSILKQHKIRIIDINPAYSKPTAYTFQYTITARAGTNWSLLCKDLEDSDEMISEVAISQPTT